MRKTTCAIVGAATMWLACGSAGAKLASEMTAEEVNRLNTAIFDQEACTTAAGADFRTALARQAKHDPAGFATKAESVVIEHFRHVSAVCDASYEAIIGEFTPRATAIARRMQKKIDAFAVALRDRRMTFAAFLAAIQQEAGRAVPEIIETTHDELGIPQQQ
jgi:hypothetical protein